MSGQLAEVVDTAALAEFNERTEKIRKLLEDWLHAGVDLMLELRAMELSGVWKAPGKYATFSDYFRDEFRGAMGIERYTNVIRAIDAHGEEFVRKIGILAAHAVSVEAIVKDPKRIAELQASVEVHKQTHGSYPEVDTVVKMRNGIAPELVRKHPATKKFNQLVDAQSALRDANADVRKLQKRVKELETQVEQLQKELDVLKKQ